MNEGMYRAGPTGGGGLPLPRVHLGAFTGATIGVAVVALLMPFGLLFGSGPADAWRLFRNGGAGMFVLALFAIVIPITLGITGAFAVRGKRVPPGLFFGVATMPLFVFMACAYRALRQMAGAFAFGAIDPIQMMRINGMGTAEAYSLDVFGGYITCGCAIIGTVALLSSVASIDVTTATRTEAQRPSAALGAATLVAGAAWFVATLVVTALRLRSVGPLALCAVLVLGVLVPLAVFAARAASVLRIWHDAVEARRGSAALLVAGLVGMLAILALEHAMVARVGSQVLEAIATEAIDPSQRARILMDFVDARKWANVAYAIHGVLGTATFGLALAGSIGNGRHPISPSGVIAASVAVFALAAAFGLDVARARMTEAVASVGRQDPPKDVDLPTVPIGIDDGRPAYDGTIKLSANGKAEPGDKISVRECAPGRRSYTVFADRGAPIDALAERVGTGRCFVELVLVAKIEKEPDLDARFGDLAVYLHRDHATLGVTFDEAALESDYGRSGTAIFRAAGENELEWDGHRAKLPLTHDSPTLKESRYSTVKLVVRPTDKIDFVVRAIASIKGRFSQAFPERGLHVLLELERAPAPMPSDPTLVGAPSGLRFLPPIVAGRLPPERVERIVKQSAGRFRVCYDEGLRKDPRLAGTVRVKFVIGRTGAVATASDAASTLPDRDVTACIIRGFSALSFSEPEGGIVVVTQTMTLVP